MKTKNRKILADLKVEVVICGSSTDKNKLKETIEKRLVEDIVSRLEKEGKHGT